MRETSPRGTKEKASPLAKGQPSKKRFFSKSITVVVESGDAQQYDSFF
jgi:hypothetical protein